MVKEYIVIITNATPESKYFDQLLAFLTSVQINSPEHPIHVFLANYPEDVMISLQKTFSKFVFENRKIKMIDERGFSLIIFRAELIKECFEKYKEPVAWIDIDVLVRKDLSEFLEIRSNQLKILRRELPPNPGLADAPINAGIFNIGYSEASYNFICDWLKGCVTNPVWGQGQMKLWKSYKKHSNDIELVKMTHTLHDIGGRERPDAFSNESVMWHCKSNHFKNPRYQIEYQKYLKIGQDLFKK